MLFALSGGPRSVPAVDERACFRQDRGRKRKAGATGLLSHVQTKEKRLQKGKSNKMYIYIYVYVYMLIIGLCPSGLCPANERRRYFVTTSLIGWAQT